MPPRVRYTREAVVDAAVQVVRRGGMQALNARSIAAQLGCSTQPLYSVMPNMEALRAAVYDQAVRIFTQTVTGAQPKDMPSYKAAGMALLRFANEERELYKLLLLRNRNGEKEQGEDPSLSQASDAEYAAIMQATGYSLDMAKAFHGHMFVYIQGLAAMIASGYLPYLEDRCSHLLTEEYQALRLLYDQQV